MAGGPSEVKTPKGLFALLGLLWLLVILLGVFLYVTHRFVLYLNTLPSGGVSDNTQLVITSPAFRDGETIPALYTCDAKQISLPLTFSRLPDGTESLAVIMEDRDVPKHLKSDGVFLHWSVFNISPSKSEIGTGEIAGVQGASGNGVAGYVGPCPPREYDPSEHRYVIDAYALDTDLPLEEGAPIDVVRDAMRGHILDHAVLTGRYERSVE